MRPTHVSLRLRPETARDYYNDLELRVEIDKEDVKICGVFCSQDVCRGKRYTHLG